MVSLVLAACWLPASSHPILEAAGWIHQAGPGPHASFPHDHGHTHPGDPSADHSHPGESSGPGDADHQVADGLCRAEAVGVQVPAMVLRPVGDWLTPFLATFADRWPAAPPRPGPSPPGTSPPDLEPHWRFSRRAALPVRAPSFFS